VDFIEELQWRKMLHDKTPGVEERLSNGMTVGYIGFDPTAPSLTIGNYVQIMLLRLFQMSGHKPIFLLGGATGRIGDPSGKSEERNLQSYEILDQNLAFQKEQAAKFLDFDCGPNSAMFLNNHDFYKNMNVLDFLRDVGKNLTVNYMLSKDSVKKRLEHGLSFTEFSYQLLQANDFLHLKQSFDCEIQMGGSDQWGNITSGTEFIRRNNAGKAFAITTPLLTKADGSKFGKSEGGNIWLDPKMTSPYKFYQFWINAADDDIGSYTRYFTLKSQKEVQSAENNYADDPRMLKKELAEELTKRVHSDDAFQSVMQVSEILFNKKADAASLKAMSLEALDMVAAEIPGASISKDQLANGMPLADFLTDGTGILGSKGDVRRAVKNNAISINKIKMSAFDALIDTEQLIQGKYIMVENGKKNKFFINIT